MGSIHESNDKLLNVITLVRNGDASAFYNIYDLFKKQITKYSYKLDGEDTIQDLSLFLLELVYSMPLEKFTNDGSDTIQRYISTCLRNEYIKLSKAKQHSDILLDDPESTMNTVHSQYDPNIKFELGDAFNLLNDKQKMVMLYRYVYGYSIADIANKLNITRQAANQMKNRAIKILQEIYC